MFDPSGIPPEQEVFRAYLYDNHCDENGKPTLKVFLRRPRDKKGLSVGSSPETATEHLEFHFGCCVLLAGRIRSVYGLDVEPDSPTHANITGVPFRAEDEQRALQIASDLQRLARSTDFPRKPTA